MVNQQLNRDHNAENKTSASRYLLGAIAGAILFVAIVLFLNVLFSEIRYIRDGKVQDFVFVVMAALGSLLYPIRGKLVGPFESNYLLYNLIWFFVASIPSALTGALLSSNSQRIRVVGKVFVFILLLAYFILWLVIMLDYRERYGPFEASMVVGMP